MLLEFRCFALPTLYVLSKFIKALRAKGSDGLNGNAIELFSAESGGDPSLLEALKFFTDRRITKCSFVFPEKVTYLLNIFFSAFKLSYNFPVPPM